MPVTSIPLGKPLAVADRGGDCRARDLDLGRNVHGPHQFRESHHCKIENGLMQVTVGPANEEPSLAIKAWRGAVAVEDVLSDVLSDVLPGSTSTPAWIDMGTVVVDVLGVVVGDVYHETYFDTYGGGTSHGLLLGVELVEVSPASVTIRLHCAHISSIFVTLFQGTRQVRVQHGDPLGPVVVTERRIRWASPSLDGLASPGRVEEDPPAVDGFPRYLGALNAVTVDAGEFALTSLPAATVVMGAGVGTHAPKDTPSWLHRQLGDASQAQLFILEDEEE